MPFACMHTWHDIPMNEEREREIRTTKEKAEQEMQLNNDIRDKLFSGMILLCFLVCQTKDA